MGACVVEWPTDGQTDKTESHRPIRPRIQSIPEMRDETLLAPLFAVAVRGTCTRCNPDRVKCLSQISTELGTHAKPSTRTPAFNHCRACHAGTRGLKGLKVPPPMKPCLGVPRQPAPKTATRQDSRATRGSFCYYCYCCCCSCRCYFWKRPKRFWFGLFKTIRPIYLRLLKLDG